MSESGQTDAQRRALRVKQRGLKSKIADERSEMSEKISDLGSDQFEKVRAENNKLYSDVAYTREAVLDSENMDLIAARAARQVDKLISVPRYDAGRLAAKLRSKCSVTIGGVGFFDWKLLGLESGPCYNAVPSHVSFLNGPIDASYTPKQRKKAERRRRAMDDDGEEEEVGTIQQKKKSKDQDKLSAAEKQVSDIRKLLTKKSQEDLDTKIAEFSRLNNLDADITSWTMEQKKEFKKQARPGEVCATNFLFNPKSFTQTVENIFGLSFLVKDGSAKVGMRTDEECKSTGATPGPWVTIKEKLTEEIPPPARQAIVALSIEDWKAMVEAYEVKESIIPHRGRSKIGRKK